MQTVTTKAMAKVAAVATGLAMATSMLSLAPMAHAAALTSAQVSAILSLLSSFGADASTIANVNASLTGQPVQVTSNPNAGACPALTRDLQLGSSGLDVKALQQFLNSKATTQIASAGAGSPGSESTYFGGLTKAAAMKFQAANGVTPIAGYVGKVTRAAIAAVCGYVVVTPPGQNPPPTAGTGTGLKVSLSPASPNGTVLVQGQGIGDLGDFVFANPTATPINVTGLTFKR